MKTKTVIELSKEDLKKILCEHFNFQFPTAVLIINVVKGSAPFESDYTEIKLEAEIKDHDE
ncbi:hypothetical protein CLU96_1890 [Chryseobacterium sp. 52]|uniref:hypothetical protein n=1 Tax=Chryseobacterium sp. 52 TaxID=2035213 RepID=UPI000C187DE2|nr:hypothetical protein [Chryseobacterium sp. 52]PIF44894.1 hypothetical protein CLU96_1890 [Chryseobacterium sp. 52]